MFIIFRDSIGGVDSCVSLRMQCIFFLYMVWLFIFYRLFGILELIQTLPHLLVQLLWLSSEKVSLAESRAEGGGHHGLLD